MRLSRAEVLTIPNAITGVRALGIPLFLWSYLVLENLGLSLVILVIGAVSDYFDGKVARALNQETKLGAALDPAIDRAYIGATLVALVIDQKIPLWVLLVLIGRDIWLGVMLIVKRRNGSGVFEVTFLGKSATFSLLYAFPFLLVGGEGGIARLFTTIGWAFACWGIGLYLVTGLQYTRLAFVGTFDQDVQPGNLDK